MSNHSSQSQTRREAQNQRAEEESDRIDAAASALERARLAANSAGYQPGDNTYRSGKVSGKRRKEMERSKRGNDSDSMVSLGAVFSRFIADRGWKEPVAVGSVATRWADIVGPEIAENAQIEHYHDTELVIRCESAAWATQLRLMSGQLQHRFDTVLGTGVITKIEIKGPDARGYGRGQSRGWGQYRRRG